MMKYFDLAKISTGIALLLLASLYLTLTSRSVWIDEAMLLKNIIDLQSPLDFMTPLPYYDQAEPVLASLFLKTVTAVFHYDIRSLRLSVLAVSVLMFLPICLLYRHYKWGVCVLLITVLGNSFSTAFQVTELKHYFLEVSGSYLAVLAIWNAEKKDNVLWIIVMAGVISLMGFSTLIISGGLLGYAALWFLMKKETRLHRVNLLAFLCSSALVVCAYGYMKYLTTYQINNYSQYASGSFVHALYVLGDALLGAYGKALLITSVLSSALLFTFTDRGFIYKLNVFFCALVVVVLAGKLSGFYPVTYPRHVIWLVPFSLVISSYAILEFIKSAVPIFKVLGWILLTVLLLQAGKACYKNAQGVNYEYTDNAGLYRYLANMAPSTILVHPNAQPSLEFYRLWEEGLRKHDVRVARDERTKVRAPAMERAELQGAIDELLRNRPAGPFYFLTSHLDLQANETGLGTVLESEVSKFHCIYTSAFAVTDAELLLMNCGVPHE